MAKKQKRRHPQTPLGPRGPSFEEFMERVRLMQEAGELEESLRVLEEAPPQFQRRPELLLIKGITLMALGYEEAVSVLEESHRRAPDHLLTAIFLGWAYSNLGLNVHAIRLLHPLREIANSLGPEVGPMVQDALAEAESAILVWAGVLNVSREVMEEALYQAEQATRLAEAGDYLEAVRFVRKASQLIPEWLMPRRMEAEMLFAAGRLREAIQLSEQMHAQYPDEMGFVLSLARYYLALGDRDRAEAILQPLKTKPLRFWSVRLLEEAAKIFGLLEDDQTLYDLYQRHRRLVVEIEDGFPLITLGSAAANVGDFRTAQRLWRRASTAAEVLQDLVNRLIRASRLQLPGLGRCTRYPTGFSAWLLTPSVARELGKLLEEWEEDEIGEEQFRKRLRALNSRAPRMLDFLIQSFREEGDIMLWMDALFYLGTPEALEEIRLFAFSQEGDFAERLAAAQRLIDAEVIDPSRPVELWDEDRGEWRPFIIPPWREIDAIPSKYGPRVRPLMDQIAQALAHRQIDEAIKAAEKIVTLEPENPHHYYTIGSLYQEKGDVATAEVYYQKTAEMDPRHVFARSSLALMAMSRGDLATAQQHLEKAARREPLPSPELAVYLHTLAVLGLTKGDLAYACFCAESGLETGLQKEVFYALLKEISIKELAPFREARLQRMQQQEAEKRRQPIPANASLAECLNRLTKNGLTATARIYHVPYNVRKAQLIQTLVDVLCDPSRLSLILPDLSDEERQALRDVLNAGGGLPWETFTSRYGHDLEEIASHWHFREPQTVMGRLRMYGLLSDGTVEGEYVVLIPRELRAVLPSLLNAQ